MNVHPTETISMASMPLVPQTAPMAVLHNQVSQLMEKEGMPLDSDSANSQEISQFWGSTGRNCDV